MTDNSSLLNLIELQKQMIDALGKRVGKLHDAAEKSVETIGSAIATINTMAQKIADLEARLNQQDRQSALLAAELNELRNAR